VQAADLYAFVCTLSDAGALEEKENLDGIRTPEVSASTPSDVLDYSQIFGLSADTPKFYPRQSTDTNEFLQMVWLRSSCSNRDDLLTLASPY
jgi:hypothetical protein